MVRGPWILSRYYGSEGEDALRDGWFPTGDVATLDRTATCRSPTARRT